MQESSITSEQIKLAVETYQCSGCIGGSYTECYKENKEDKSDKSCIKHKVGTFGIITGTFFLGMPKGFNRLGSCKDQTIGIFEYLDIRYDKFNVPVWKHVNEKGHVLVRGLSPRINSPFLHIFLDTIAFNDIKCLEITDKDLEEMD